MSVTVEIENGRPKGYLTTEEYAKKIGKKVSFVDYCCKNGKIDSIVIGRKRFISENHKAPALVRRNKTDYKKLLGDDFAGYLTIKEFADSNHLKYCAVHHAIVYSHLIDGVLKFDNLKAGKNYSGQYLIPVGQKALNRYYAWKAGEIQCR